MSSTTRPDSSRQPDSTWTLAFFSKSQELPEDPELLEQDDEERVDCSPTFFPDLPCQEQLDDINRLLAETKQAADGQARGHALTG